MHRCHCHTCDPRVSNAPNKPWMTDAPDTFANMVARPTAASCSRPNRPPKIRDTKGRDTVQNPVRAIGHDNAHSFWAKGSGDLDGSTGTPMAGGGSRGSSIHTDTPILDVNEERGRRNRPSGIPNLSSGLK